MPFPSKKWLEEHNMRVVFDKGIKYHLEPKLRNPNLLAKRPPYNPKPLDANSSREEKEWNLGEVLDTVDGHYRIIEEQLGKVLAKLDVMAERSDVLQKSKEMMKNGKNKSASRKA